jgi:Coenzyme PQQ synthesis protein D (PqqD)
MSERFVANEPKIVFEASDDEVVIVNLDTGSYYTVDRGGARIWSLLIQGLSVPEIAGHFERANPGPVPDVRSAVAGFVEELKAEGLVRIAADRAPNLMADPPGVAGQTLEPPHLQKFTDMENLLLLDPVHEVDATGWPNQPRGTPNL